jgi:ABC-type Fe3+/spermidine/putrescine transport system ATPase subunit
VGLNTTDDVPLLRGESIVRRFGRRTVVDVAAIDVRAGEVLAVLGPNGAGKSTLFRILFLLERPDSGTVHVDGAAARAGDTVLMRRMSAVFQRAYLFDGTVRDNIAYGLRARGVAAAEIEKRVAAALSLVSLERFSARHIGTLSGGEAQRVGLARALVLEPSVLGLDEPTLQLDVTARRRFREDIERIARTHARATLLITHDPADAFALADRIAVMEGGRIIQVGTPSEIILQPATAFIAEFTGAELLLHGTVVNREGDLAEVALTGGTRIWALATDPRAVVGSSAHVAYRPEDIALAAAGTETETSAVNRFDLRVDAVVPAGALVRVRLTGDVSLTARLTTRSMTTLGIVPGLRVTAHLKAAALRAFPAAQ